MACTHANFVSEQLTLKKELVDLEGSPSKPNGQVTDYLEDYQLLAMGNR
jgi:hypothetical protein